jgi:peptidoglycan/LPS O-acetylase OafA/YrhL
VPRSQDGKGDTAAVATARASTDRARSRIRGTDGVRALAAVSILVYHVWLYGSPTGKPVDLGIFSRFVTPHLPVGVTLFFTLSGFLLYRPIAASVLHRKALPHVRTYLKNRGLRILPAYWVVLLATAVLLPAVQVRLSPSNVELGRLALHPAQLAANLGLMQNYFSGSLDSGIGPTWSLVLPLLGLLAAGLAVRTRTIRSRTFAALVPSILLFLVGAATYEITAHMSSSRVAYPILVRSFLNHADLFAFGMALAVLLVNVQDGVVVLPKWWRKAAFMALVALVPTTMILVDRGTLLTYKGALQYETLTAAAAVLLLALVVLPTSRPSVPLLTRILDSRVFVAVGLASYSVFLWHEPLIRWLQANGMTFGGRAGFLENLVTLGALTTLAAGLTYWFVERPALARKQRGRDSMRRGEDGRSTGPSVHPSDATRLDSSGRTSTRYEASGQD